MAMNENDIYNLKTIVREFEINRRIGFKETMLFCESTMITEMVVSITKKSVHRNTYGIKPCIFF